MVFTAGGAQFFSGLPKENACPKALLLACLGYVIGFRSEDHERHTAGVERGRTLFGMSSSVQAQLLTAKADYFPLYSHAPPRESAQSNSGVSKLLAPLSLYTRPPCSGVRIHRNKLIGRTANLV